MIDYREVRRIARMMIEAVKLDRAYSIHAISQATKPDFQTSGSCWRCRRRRDWRGAGVRPALGVGFVYEVTT